MLQDFLELRRRTFNQLFCGLDGRLEMGEIFGMSQRHEKEGFLPRCLESCIVTDLNPFKRQVQRLGILCANARAVFRNTEREN